MTARLVAAVLRDERLVAPVGTYQPRYGVTLSLQPMIGSTGVAEVLNLSRKTGNYVPWRRVRKLSARH